MPAGWDEFTADELAYALAESRGRAEDMLTLAVRLAARLPGTAAALRAGTLTRGKAEIIAWATALLDPAEARAAEALVLGRAGRLTPGGRFPSTSSSWTTPDRHRRRPGPLTPLSCLDLRLRTTPSAAVELPPVSERDDDAARRVNWKWVAAWTAFGVGLLCLASVMEGVDKWAGVSIDILVHIGATLLLAPLLPFGVVEDDDAVAQQAPPLPGVAGDGAGRGVAGAGDRGAGGWWGHMGRLRVGDGGRMRVRAAGGWPGRDGAGGRGGPHRQVRSRGQLAAAMTGWGGPGSAPVRAAMAGWRRILSRQRRRVGPMLPTGMPSRALIWAYGTGGSATSRAISCWPCAGRSANAWRSAACRSAASRSCPAAPACSSAMVSASSGYRAAWCLRAARTTRPHSRRVVVASHPGSAAGLADLVQLVHQAQPDALADVVGVGPAEPVPAADRPDQRGVPLDQGVPRMFVAAPGQGHQACGPRVITRRADILSRGFKRGTGCHSGHHLVLLSKHRPPSAPRGWEGVPRR